MVLLFLLLLFPVWGSPSPDMQCSLPRSASMSLTITSRRNQTGHRFAQIRLDHGAQKDSPNEAETGAWEVDMDHSTVICDGIESVNIVATVTGPDYELFPGMGYYKLHTTPRTWNEALRTCAVEGAHLAIVNSESEARFLQLLFSRHPKITGGNHNDYAYLGVHDMFSEGQFTTIFGDPLNNTGYMKWVGGQPDNGGAEPGSDCLSLYRAQANFNDLPCNWKLAAFCEQEVY
ncbi:hemolymph lipopolysaccharide-binding protein-like isoform X2 [Zootermopsis nevadensis]|uniref:hemolymph lipopolysaccharide-binding protein-like isoform X2 n=1 Tax=Zootermopsis nevadensis TaxID=136037 RepID=UPI000B8ED07B|nr:hemolymph lipopolysaccharide-binding protein-like isoform X2 [Zootermopsis nevadensis]